MHSEKQVINKAASVKIRMRDRIPKIEMLASNIGKASAGLAPEIKEDRLQTMNKELDTLAEKQYSDSLILATFRWVLGITEDIEPGNLELDL